MTDHVPTDPDATQRTDPQAATQQAVELRAAAARMLDQAVKLESAMAA